MGAQKRCLISRDRIARRVTELAEQIARDYAGRDLVMVGWSNLCLVHHFCFCHDANSAGIDGTCQESPHLG